MSVKVAVVCEDPSNDRYIVEPIVAAVLKRLGKPAARIQIVESPKTTGLESVVENACEFVRRYGAIASVVLFVIDGDCQDGSPGTRNNRARLENAIAACQRHAEKAAVVVAQQEVEVWALWGVRASLGTPWETVRAECHPKEMYFDPQITAADRLTADGGRKRLVTASLSAGLQSLEGGCTELAHLATEIESRL